MTRYKSFISILIFFSSLSIGISLKTPRERQKTGPALPLSP